MRAGGGRAKGAAFERQIAGMLFDELGIKFKRNLEQYQMKNLADLTSSDASFPFLLELKRYKRCRVIFLVGSDSDRRPHVRRQS